MPGSTVHTCMLCVIVAWLEARGGHRIHRAEAAAHLAARQTDRVHTAVLPTPGRITVKHRGLDGS